MRSGRSYGSSQACDKAFLIDNRRVSIIKIDVATKI